MHRLRSEGCKSRERGYGVFPLDCGLRHNGECILTSRLIYSGQWWAHTGIQESGYRLVENMTENNDSDRHRGRGAAYRRRDERPGGRATAGAACRTGCAGLYTRRGSGAGGEGPEPVRGPRPTALSASTSSSGTSRRAKRRYISAAPRPASPWVPDCWRRLRRMR